MSHISAPYPPDALILAPLSGYTDLPYRRAARECGCRFAFTEMVDAASLAYARKRSEGMLLRGEEEEFLGVQLVGADHEFLKKAVDVLNEYDFSLLDFNLGCPVPPVSGSSPNGHATRSRRRSGSSRRTTRRRRSNWSAVSRSWARGRSPSTAESGRRSTPDRSPSTSSGRCAKRCRNCRSSPTAA